jgi:hypothetical protein
MRVSFGKTWDSRTLDGALLDWSENQAAGTLEVLLDADAVRRARKATSLGTARWEVGGREYQTVNVCTLPAGGIVKVFAQEDD